MTPLNPRRRHAERGSALLVAVVIILLLGMVGLAVVKAASRETEAVGAKRAHDATITCADAARNLLMSQFSAYGVSPLSMTLDKTVNGYAMKTGHGDTVALSNVKSVEAVPAGASSASGGQGNGSLSDLSNRMGGTASPTVAGGTGSGQGGGLGGQLYRMTVTCSSPSPSGGSARVAEVEYLVRFGL